MPLAVLSLFLVAANLPALLHVLTTNPLQLYADLQNAPPSHLLPGQPIIDPNAGYVTQALGHVAASSWLHGHVPWWNPYEGVGAPLTGEMQSAAFFPPTLLLDGTWGFPWFHLLLELWAGWSMYFLLRRLRVVGAAAVAGGVAFGLVGTFAWFSHAPANPVAFLPMALLGVELCRDAATKRAAGGWVLLAVALALSVVAGFPEVAYIDGLLVVVWALARMATIGPDATAFVRKLAAGAGVAVLLSAPVIVAFVTYLPHADVGGHTNAFANAALPRQAIPQLLLPYVYGPIFALHNNQSSDIFTLIWGNVGGYLDATIVCCALVGLVGRRLRLLRVALALYALVMLARTYGIGPFWRLVSDIPGLHQAATYRYSQTSWELAVIVLAALGIDDLARRKVHRSVLLGAGSVTAALTIWATASAWPILSEAVGAAHRHVFASTSALWALLGVGTVVVGGLLALRSDAARAEGRRFWGSARIGVFMVAGAVAVDALAMGGAPQLSAPRPAPVDMALIRYLQGHLGLARFTTLGPVMPNFGSYFGIAELNVNDLPEPKAFANYVLSDLAPNTDPLVFTGTVSTSPTGPSPGQELTTHLAQYEGLGVKYVVEPAGGVDAAGSPWPPPGHDLGVRLVYADAVARVYQLPATAPIFTSIPAGACSIDAQGWNTARVRCSSDAQLERRVLELPGWRASVGGRPVTVQIYGGLVQRISVPRGTSYVAFSFKPPHETLAEVAALVGIVLVGVGVLSAYRPRRRGQPFEGGEPGPEGPLDDQTGVPAPDEGDARGTRPAPAPATSS